MQRLLLVSILGLAACASNAARAPSSSAPGATPTTAGSDDVICADEVSPATGMTHRVCHRQVAASAETGETDVQCTDEVPTGTNMTKRICRSQTEKAHDRAVVEDIYLDPSARPHIVK